MVWFDGPYTETMEDEFHRIMRRIYKNSRATVVHQETCPCCGAKLVNLYRRDKKGGPRLVTEWKCRRCWEKHDKEADHGKWGKWLGYSSDPCPNCGRVRRERYENGKEVCEKCGWCPQENRYVTEEEIYPPEEDCHG